MNRSATIFDMVDPICGDELLPYGAPTCKAYDLHEAEFAYQPGYFDEGFTGILDECDPVIKALATDAPIVLSRGSSERKARVVANASQIDASQGMLFSNEPTVDHASPASADASPSTSARASLPEETYSAPASPLFTPTSEPVDLPCVQESVEPEALPDLPNAREEYSTTIKPVDAAQVPTAPVLVTSLSPPSGSLPVCAADIDVLSHPGPPASSFQSGEIAPDFPSPGASDATASSPSFFELSPIPGSKLANIIRKRKRGLIADDDYQPAMVPDAFPSCAVQDQPFQATRTARPASPSLSQSDSVVEVDAPTTARNKYATSVPPSLLDEIAAAAVAATIRASPGVNVFATPYNTKRARKTSKRSKKSTPGQAASLGSLMNPAAMGPRPYMPNAQWQGAGMPPAPFAISPSQANINAPQAYTSQGPGNVATYASSAGPVLYGPGNTNAKRRRVVGPCFTGQPIARQGAATFPTAGYFQPHALSASGNAPPFMNTESNHCGIVTPEIQQYPIAGTHSASSSLDFIQPPPSNLELPQISDNWSGAGQNWADPLQTGPSLPLQQDIINHGVGGDFQTMSHYGYGGSPSSSQIPARQPLAHAPETLNTQDAPASRKIAPPKRSKQPSSDKVTPPQAGIRETFTCKITGCNKPISILRNGAWSVKRVLQEHGHLAEYPTDDTITCQWVGEDGRRCMQRTKWANYTRHFSGHLGVLVRQCEFCASVQARPSNLARHYRTCRAFQRQDYETRRAAWMKLNTRQDFEEFEMSMGRMPRPPQ